MAQRAQPARGMRDIVPPDGERRRQVANRILDVYAAYGYEASYDLNAPQPTQDVVASMLLDGERPFGARSSNRTSPRVTTFSAPGRLTAISVCSHNSMKLPSIRLAAGSFARAVRTCSTGASV